MKNHKVRKEPENSSNTIKIANPVLKNPNHPAPSPNKKISARLDQSDEQAPLLPIKRGGRDTETKTESAASLLYKGESKSRGSDEFLRLEANLKDLKQQRKMMDRLVHEKLLKLDSLSDPATSPSQISPRENLKEEINFLKESIASLDSEIHKQKFLLKQSSGGIVGRHAAAVGNIHNVLAEAEDADTVLTDVTLPLTEVTMLVQKKEQYNSLAAKIKKLKAKLNKQGIKHEKKVKLEKKIEKLTHEKQELGKDLVQSFAKTANSSVHTAVEGTEFLAELAPELISESLSSTTEIASSLTGAVAVGLNAKQLHDKKKQRRALRREIETVRENIKNETNAPVKEILEMRLKCLQFQLDDNKFGTTKSKIGIAAGLTGTGAGVATLAGVSTAGAIGATVVTAGGAAIVFGVLAAALGIGKLVYNNRYSIKSSSQEMKINMEKKVLEKKERDLKDSVRRHEKEKRSMESLKSRADSSSKAFESILPYYDELDIRKESISNLKKVRDDLVILIGETKQSADPLLVESLKHDIANLKGLIKQSREECRKLEETIQFMLQKINSEAESLKDKKYEAQETIKVKSEILEKRKKSSKSLESSIKSKEMTIQNLKGQKDSNRMKERLNETTPEEIETFIESLTQRVTDPQTSQQISRFLEDQGVDLVNQNLYQATIQYIVSNVK